ncbi:L-seryl-tRNA(Sec) selenium transferase [Planococcus sp. CAU13]|uniref:L-seryl-tRNA(Sec) selenium transferase n=1 Tax=Planococcus sp. CAU13 TaxID=1541197 RepID=UPI00052FF11F|nr:L-seryl-tRNA(Sec) selenium transferase [Planococcus sp. CAU13]
MKQYLRQLPPVHELQKDRRFKEFLESYDLTAERGTKFIQQELNALREKLLKDESPVEPSESNFAELIFSNAEHSANEWNEDRLMRVINGTGTVLHTNLGRARLSSRAVEHVMRAARDYSNLEYRVAEGKRGSRHDILEDLIQQTTGAEAAMVVNNNAAAVFLILSALAKGKEVIVSRGQLVEIGGSFRVSSIMEESGAHLREVGTTNKTHLFDYENAIKEETAMVMKVHTSNFVMSGFTATVETEALAELKARHEGLIFYEDLGSGALYDFKKHGIGNEPHVRDVIAAGVDIVSFSGDKLLGGPQAGIIAGNKDLIDKLKKHQLARALRVDKMTFAALEETLKVYVAGGDAVLEIPTVRDIMRSSEEIKTQAENFVSALASSTGSYRIQLLDGTSQVGGGTMPEVEIPTFLAAIRHESLPPQELAARLRENRPPVIGRIQDDQVCIDFRTVREDEMDEVVESFVRIAETT